MALEDIDIKVAAVLPITPSKLQEDLFKPLVESYEEQPESSKEIEKEDTTTARKDLTSDFSGLRGKLAAISLPTLAKLSVSEMKEDMFFEVLSRPPIMRYLTVLFFSTMTLN